MIMASATASIGNVIVTETEEKTYEVYSLLDFIGFWVYGIFGICIAVLIGPFINIWLGSDYLIEASTGIMLCVNFYVCGVQNVNSNFRNAYRTPTAILKITPSKFTNLKGGKIPFFLV
jgi:hypothetical protein